MEYDILYNRNVKATFRRCLWGELCRMVRDKATLRQAVRHAIRHTEALDLWTNLSTDPMGDGAAVGIDVLLSEHPALIAQAHAAGLSLPTDRRVCADTLFEALFVRHPPIGVGALQVLLTLERLQMPLDGRSIEAARAQQAATPPGLYFEKVLDAAKLRGIACALDPFTDQAGALWQRFERSEVSQKMLPVLSVESLQKAVFEDAPLIISGCVVENERNGAHVAHIAHLLGDWARHIRARMVRASFPQYAAEHDLLMRYAILPVCEEQGLPLLMILAYGAEQTAQQLAWVQDAAKRSDSLRFVLVSPTEESAGVLATWCTADARRNVCPVFATQQQLPARMDLLGIYMTPCASGAKVLEHLVGAWVYARRAIAQALYERYLPLIKLGWGIEPQEIEANVACLLGGNWEAFCKRGAP